jgi:hypothetical protein
VLAQVSALVADAAEPVRLAYVTEAFAFTRCD